MQWCRGRALQRLGESGAAEEQFEHAVASGREVGAPLIAAMALRDMGTPAERLREACGLLMMSRGSRVFESFEAALSAAGHRNVDGGAEVAAAASGVESHAA